MDPAVRPERKDAAENRQRILQEAQRLFDQYGAAQVSMNQIAAAAGVGPGTLYRRYANKSELCYDLMKDDLAGLYAEIDHYLDQHRDVSPSQRLRHVIARFIDFRERKLHLFAGLEEPPQAHSANSRFNALHDCFVALFDEMNPTADSASVFKADLLLSALNGDSYSFQREVRGYSPAQVLERICQAFLVG